jgi:hypothetical protein
MHVHCGKCNIGWEIRVPVPIPIPRFVKLVNAHVTIGCPQCGAAGKHVLCGPPPKEKPDVTETQTQAK